MGCGERLLAALALQVVHGVDRNRVTAHAVNVIHGEPPSDVSIPAVLRSEFSLYNRNATDVIPLHVVISACRETTIVTAATDIAGLATAAQPCAHSPLGDNWSPSLGTRL